jgi:signal transduction histidine kinase
MTSFYKNISWKPSTVSWLSFALMSLIVAGIGLSGSAHVVNYLQDRLLEHGIEHNQEIATALAPKLEQAVMGKSQDITSSMARMLEDYNVFDFRVFVVDIKNRAIVFDSGMQLDSPLPINQSWLSHAGTTILSDALSLSSNGKRRALGDQQHPTLFWLQTLNNTEPDRWVLGIAKDQSVMIDFMGDLHWHLDAVLLLTYALIALLGYFAMRSIGRIYERRLEAKVSDRTQELEAAYEDILLKTRLATIGQTASVLTHEMRNPLASIKLALSGLKGSESLTEREMRRVALVLGEVDRLDDLLSETLDYVRPVKLSETPVDMNHLVTKVIEQQKPVLEEHDITLQHTECTDCTAMRVDQAQMHQVILNIVKNAIEASPQGGIIEASVGREGDVLKIEIGNQGDLLDETVLKKAFEPFFTTRPKGTGLGLGLVKRVMEEHGGSVKLQSNTERGTLITLILPINNVLKIDPSESTG